MSDTGNDPTENLHAQVERALEALDAEALREVILDMLLALDHRTLAAVAPVILERAARSGADWRPDPLNESQVAEAVAFAAAAQRIGYAEPADVDTHLNNAGLAFLGRDYPAAYRIFHALIPPLAERMFHLGEDEMLDEVLGVDPGECAGQYLVCVYLLSNEETRPQALRETLNELHGFCFVSQPLRTLERAALDPLPGLDDFLHRWRGQLEGDAAGEPGPWDSPATQWLREAVRRLEGTAGLAALARSSRRGPDLRAWCESLVDDRDWPAALAAFAEAAELADSEWLRASLLDGAALCAKELGGEGLSLWLERAWRTAPSLTRLLRWLGAAPDTATLQHRAALALAACPPADPRQRAWLHVLRGEFDAAAALLAAAPGLGWSSPQHPGQKIGKSGTDHDFPGAPYRRSLLSSGLPRPWMAGMPRRPRLVAPGIPLHLIQRGNNRSACFYAIDDRLCYLQWLAEYAMQADCAVHAYVLMTNHVHLLVTPGTADGPGAMMKRLGQRYVQYVNRTYRRSGTLWEGRFRSCIVETDSYFLTCQRYMELNPVRAGMAAEPGAYPWSSYRANAYGESNPVLTPHGVYLALGRSRDGRLAAYRRLFEGEVTTDDLKAIRTATNGNFALGGSRFRADIARTLSCRVTPGRPGRPPCRAEPASGRLLDE